MSENEGNTSPPNMIYHYPLDLGPQTSGSRVQMAQLLQGFREIGYEVAPMIGLADARAATWREIQAGAARVRRFDFAYMRSPIVPTLRARRNAIRPWADPVFFAWCRRQGIPIGLFYADVHYRLDHFRANVPWPNRTLMQALFRLDWLIYRRFVDHLFLPSLRLAALLPTTWPAERMSALWPGCPTPAIQRAARSAGDLKLFYVGGIVPPLYDLKPMVEAISQLPGVSLTLCCRADEWAKKGSYYGTLDPARCGLFMSPVSACGPTMRKPTRSACSGAIPTWTWRCQSKFSRLWDMACR